MESKTHSQTSTHVWVCQTALAAVRAPVVLRVCCNTFEDTVLIYEYSNLSHCRSTKRTLSTKCACIIVDRDSRNFLEDDPFRVIHPSPTFTILAPLVSFRTSPIMVCFIFLTRQNLFSHEGCRATIWFSHHNTGQHGNITGQWW